MTRSGPTRKQRRSREAFRNRPFNPYTDRLANQSLTADYKLRPDSSFSQDDLDRFNRRQDDARGLYSRRFGADSLQDVTRYDRVEDIPVYSDEEIRQQNIERLKADPRSAYNYKRPEPKFGEGPRNQKVPEAVVNSYNALTAKFGRQRNNPFGGNVNQADFDNVLNTLRDSPPEYIQEGEVYEGPDFRDPSGNLLRERKDSIYYRGPSNTDQTSTPTQTVGETRQMGRSRFKDPAVVERRARNKAKREARPQKLSYEERNPQYAEAKRAQEATRQQYANTPQYIKDLQSDFSRNGVTDRVRSGMFSLNKRRYEERYGDQGGGSGAPSSMSQPASPSYKNQPNPMPNGRSDRGNYSRGPVAMETATSTPTRRTSTRTPENPRGIDAPSESAASTPTRRPTSRSNRGTLNASRTNRASRERAIQADAEFNNASRGRGNARSTSNRDSRASAISRRETVASSRADLAGVRNQGAQDRANRETAAPAETAASTPTRRDNPRSRNRKQREQRVAADARRNRRNRGPADASTRSSRRAQREKAVVERQRGGRGQRGREARGGRRGGRGRAATR